MKDSNHNHNNGNGKQVGPYLEYIGFGLYLLPFLYQLCQMSDFCWKVLR